MQWILILGQILKALPELLKVAEKAFDDIPDSGAQKKEMVLTTIKVTVSAAIGEEFWSKIEKFVSPVINFMCLFIFPNDKDTITK